MSHQHLQNWINASALVDEIQDEVLEAKSIEALFKILVKSKTLEGLIPRKELSIVYHAYGSEKPEFWVTPDVIRERKTNDFGGTDHLDDEPKHTFSADLGCIKQVINDAKIKPVINPANAPYRNFVIIPMRLNKDKNIGAFILHNDEEKHPYDSELIKALDAISNRLAYFIRHNVRKRRIDVFQRIQLSLYRKHFKSECEIIDQFVSALSDWFEHDEIIILIKHPLDTKRFVTACCSQDEKEKGNKPHAKQDFRLTDPLSEEQLKHIFGDTREKLANNAIELTSEQEIKDHNISLACKSWLGTPMRLKKDVVIGYLILHNKQENAFEHGEEKFVDGLSDYVASLIGTHRHDTITNILRKIRDFEITGKSNDLENLYNDTLKSISHLFGIRDISIYRFDRSKNPENQFEEKAFYSKKNKNIFIPKDVKDKALKITLKHNKNIDQNKIKIHKDFNFKSEENSTCYFIAPMRIRQRSLGCFIFEARHIGSFTAQSIDDVADTLAEKVAANTRWQRDQLLSKFGSEGNKLSPLSLENILNFTHKFISQAMFTENLYIALYNQEEDKIRFPFALKNGEIWESIQGSTRIINDNKLGKTEWIIRNKEPLFHQTQAEALEWYDEPKHNEHGGHPLASWVGVPIFSERGVIGVIAAYHDELDNIYLKRDIFFLTNIANQISGLFRALHIINLSDSYKELEDLNRKLKESNKKYSNLLTIQGTLAEIERKETFSSISQDVVHNLNNRFGPISILIKSSIHHLNNLKENPYNENIFHKIQEKLTKAYTTSLDVLQNTKKVTSFEKEMIDIGSLLEKIVSEINVYFNISNHEIFQVDITDNINYLAHRSTLENVIYSIVFNSAESVKRGEINKNSYIRIETHISDGFFNIDIADNGKPRPIPLDLERKIFEYNKTEKSDYARGYGLPRAKAYFLSQSGDLILHENSNKRKVFRIKLPAKESQLTFFVLDDDKSWIDIIKEWIEDNFDAKVYSATSYRSALEKIEKIEKDNETINISFLDVSLNSEARDNSGLLLIDRLRSTTSSESKICLLTNFPSMAKNHSDYFDEILLKVKDGMPISEDEFLDTVKSLMKKKR